MNSKQLIIVGTGRCGSTMLSNILFKYEPALILSEFFSTLGYNAFKPTYVNGSEFCSILSELRPIYKTLFKNKINIHEYFNVKNEFIHPMLINVLPRLTKEPELLLDNIIHYMIKLPKMNISEMYIHLFDWLKVYFKKDLWIERSGSSLEYIENLIKFFPQAKFIHIYRNGLDCAVSMSKHYGFKAAMLQTIVEEKIGKNPFTDLLTTKEKKIIGNYSSVVPCSDFDSEVYKNFKINLSRYGFLWTVQILKSIKIFENFSRDKIFQVKYEDIINNPKNELMKIMKFIDYNFENQKLISEMALQININKKNNWSDNLTSKEKNELINSCRLGMRALGYTKTGE